MNNVFIVSLQRLITFLLQDSFLFLIILFNLFWSISTQSTVLSNDRKNYRQTLGFQEQIGTNSILECQYLHYYLDFGGFLLKCMVLFKFEVILSSFAQYISALTEYWVLLEFSMLGPSQACSTKILIDFYLGICFRIWVEGGGYLKLGNFFHSPNWCKKEPQSYCKFN